MKRPASRDGEERSDMRGVRAEEESCQMVVAASVSTLLPEDYYLDDDGKMVFTVAYHLKRGACCGNNCRHCPY
jgi:hypothetical protein